MACPLLAGGELCAVCGMLTCQVWVDRQGLCRVQSRWGRGLVYIFSVCVFATAPVELMLVPVCCRITLGKL